MVRGRPGAECAQLSVNPGCAPQRVGDRHLPDESADLNTDDGTAAGLRSRPSGPSTAEPVAMPSHDRVRLHEHQRRAPIPPDSGQDDPKQPVARPQMRTAGRAFHGSELLPQRKVLQDQFVMSTAGQRQRAANQSNHVRHVLIVGIQRAKINPRRADGVLANDTPRRTALSCWRSARCSKASS